MWEYQGISPFDITPFEQNNSEKCMNKYIEHCVEEGYVIWQ